MYKYIRQLTKPSSNDVHAYEMISRDDWIVEELIPDRPGIVSLLGPKCVNYSTNSSITWGEIIARKNELRPDLIGYLETVIDEVNPNEISLEDPFSLVKQDIYEFETLEDLKEAYSTYIKNNKSLFEDAIIKSKNICKEIFLDPTGTEITDIDKGLET